MLNIEAVLCDLNELQTGINVILEMLMCDVETPVLVDQPLGTALCCIDDAKGILLQHAYNNGRVVIKEA